MKKQLIIASVVCLVLGFVFGMQYKAYQIRSIFLEATQEISDVFNRPSTTTPVEEEIIIEKQIGEEIQLATINLKVNSVEETDILSAQYSKPTVAKANSKFVVINVDVTNTTKAQFTHYDDGLIIIDEQERVFQPHFSIGDIDNYLAGRELAPSITENGMIVFELPKDSYSYSFGIGKAGTNELYLVKLK